MKSSASGPLVRERQLWLLCAGRRNICQPHHVTIVGQHRLLVHHSIVIVTSNSPLNAQLGAAPMSPLGVITDGAARPESDPVRNGLVLLQLDS